ncbi:putative efflux pump antibiotic resistance protein [Phaeoacremonium minimum UCRPA7]|uniref:Putative efflux pump antibiotic resistance protein n=1 Tax=Phaeoacremonium minimum (strain UCR-PA7) TaxID=1286976 RepID=R8BVI8_PHAM7|nr:putative efflux pump antibiotic resistance protein [Phaeoacremonium minimum UCRPA7]EOO03319.1 putative efflux pump antibiotic resistance protein [Phaeoacremonium minimum UCRPA7]
MDAIAAQDIPYWNEAMAAKYTGNKRPYDQSDFSKFLWKYDGIIDAPAMFFLEEWIAANPDAKVILNKRSFDSWYRSVSNTGFRLTAWPWWPYIRPFQSGHLYAWYQYACTWLNLMGQQGYATKPQHERWTRENYRKTYDEHYPRVRALVPADRILEFELGKDGWNELCAFLDKDVPDQPFPHMNEAKGMVEQRLALIWQDAMKNFLKVMSTTGIAAAVFAFGWMRWRGQLVALARGITPPG